MRRLGLYSSLDQRAARWISGRSLGHSADRLIVDGCELRKLLWEHVVLVFVAGRLSVAYVRLSSLKLQASHRARRGDFDRYCSIT
jgi:hypothetical protein